MDKTIFNKDRWTEWLIAKGLGARTIKEYNYCWDKFDFSMFSQDYLMKYINKNNYLVARAFIKNLLHYIKTNDFPKEIKESLIEFEIPKITGRIKRKLPKVITEEQVIMISNSMEGERNKIMVLVCFYCGLRLNELINLKPYDFKWDSWLKDPDKAGKLNVVGKNNKERIVFVPNKLMARVYQWIKNEVVKKGQSKEDKLFIIGGRRFSYLLADSSEKVIGRRINPHLLRHTCGSWLRDQGWDLKEIAEFLGHESVNTTQIYTHISKENLKSKYEDLTKD